MSSTADIILEWKDHADDNECCHPFIAFEEFYDILDAKLFLSGKAMLG